MIHMKCLVVLTGGGKPGAASKEFILITGYVSEGSGYASEGSGYASEGWVRQRRVAMDYELVDHKRRLVLYLSDDRIVEFACSLPNAGSTAWLC